MEQLRSYSTLILQKYLSKSGTYYFYLKLLENIENNSTILDVGCGDGIYFTNPYVVKIIKEKNLKIHCIDLDRSALKILNKRIFDSHLNIDSNIKCSNTDLFELEDKYDYTFFIESFPVIPIDTFTKMLRYAFNKTNKKLFLYHNLVHNKSYLRSFIKPKIKYLTNLDFGRETTLKEMFDFLKIQKYVFNIEETSQDYMFKLFLITINK